MDKKPAEINVVKEVEESQEVPKGDDQNRVQGDRIITDMGKDEEMAIDTS